jgi:hypothetical protein
MVKWKTDAAAEDERHYQPLAAYNHISHGLDFI